LQRFRVDAIELGRAFATEGRYWHDWVLPDGTPCQIPIWITPERDGARWVLRSGSGRVLAQMPDGALYFEQTYYPFLDGVEKFDALAEACRVHVTGYASPGPIADGPGDRTSSSKSEAPQEHGP
jgi:uroporphyrinogen decarboxylase